MYPFGFDEEQHLKTLVAQFEEMLFSNDSRFFDVIEFEQIIDHYENQFESKKALQAIEYALDQHAFSTTFYIRKAHILIELGKEDEAMSCLDKAQLFDSSELEIMLLRAEILTNKQCYTEAMDILQAALDGASPPDQIEILLAMANIHEDKEDYDKAFEFLKAALIRNPKCEEALDRIWLCVEFSEKYRESIALHKKIIDLEPYSYLAWYNLGHAQACLEKYQDAIPSFEYAYIINNKFEAAYRDCAACHLELKAYDKALKVFSEALEHIRPESEFYLKIGYCYEHLDDFFRAKDFYKKAIRLDPKNAEAFYQMGEVYFKEQSWKSALSAYQKAIYLQPFNSYYWEAIAETYFHLENLEKALDCYREAVTKNPFEQSHWIQYATTVLEILGSEDALHILEEAENHIPDVSIRFCKVAALIYSGLRKEAFHQLNQALTEDYSMHQSLFELFPDLLKDSELLAFIENFD